ncbi:hypothetical protein ACWEOE_17280 [Amycolatopsis sp. NPDC004368]
MIALVVAGGAFAIAAEPRSPWAAAGLTGAVAIGGLAAWPPVPAPVVAAHGPRWEVPVRVVAAAGVVTTLAVLARVLGPQAAGLLACTPVVLSIPAPTTHRGPGFPAAETLVRSALRSLPATLAFTVVAAACLVPLGPVAAFGLASAALLVVDHLTGRLPVAQPGRAAGRTHSAGDSA